MLLLTGVGMGTRPYREANARAEEVSNILSVLGVPHAPDATSKELLDIFEKKVGTENVGNLSAHVYREGEKVKTVAVPFAGPGLWGPVKGYLSLDPDMKTIRGISFYQQEETPGLGGEIASAAFRKQFVGKKIVDAESRFGLRITKPGQASAQNEVDGISGATLTCTKVQTMLNDTVQQVAKELKRDE